MILYLDVLVEVVGIAVADHGFLLAVERVHGHLGLKKGMEIGKQVEQESVLIWHSRLKSEGH